MTKPRAMLFGPFVGEMFWEAFRFAPIAINAAVNPKEKYKGVKIIAFTREERFDLYGKHADILVPLRIKGDYSNTMKPNCFKLNGAPKDLYPTLISSFRDVYEKRFEIISHLYPNIENRQFENKEQFRRHPMNYSFAPRQKNYELIDNYLPNDKPIVVLGSRFRKGFRRNWKNWQEFYNVLSNDQFLMRNFTFVVCGKKEEYIGDEQNRFYDMTKIKLQDGASLIGLLLVILQRAFFTFGSQSAIPNLSLLHNVDVLEFGCQKAYHTKTYNVKNTPIKFIENVSYDLDANVALNELRAMLKNKMKKENL